MALTGSSGFILCSREGAEKKSVLRGVLCPEWNFGDEFEVAVNLDGELHDYILHFPLYSSVASLAIELDGDAYLGEGTGYKGVPPYCITVLRLRRAGALRVRTIRTKI